MIFDKTILLGRFLASPGARESSSEAARGFQSLASRQPGSIMIRSDSCACYNIMNMRLQPGSMDAPADSGPAYPDNATNVFQLYDSRNKQPSLLLVSPCRLLRSNRGPTLQMQHKPRYAATADCANCALVLGFESPGMIQSSNQEVQGAENGVQSCSPID